MHSVYAQRGSCFHHIKDKAMSDIMSMAVLAVLATPCTLVVL